MLLGGKQPLIVVFALLVLVLVWLPRPSYIPSGQDILNYTTDVGSYHGPDESGPVDGVTHGEYAGDVEPHSSSYVDVHSTSTTVDNDFHIATAPPVQATSSAVPSASTAPTAAETALAEVPEIVPEIIPDVEDIDPSFSGDKWYFQDDVQFPPPKLDVRTLKRYAPHNYKGPGHATFATYLATRNGSIHDPYFCAAQQQVYRLLWDPKIRSTEHPVTVFVAPFVDETQRDILEAAGALVREIDLVPWHPSHTSLPVR